MEQITEALLEIKSQLAFNAICQAVQLLCIVALLGLIAYFISKNN